MLTFLRKRENTKKIMWGLAILVIPAFVLWGSGSLLRSRNTPNYAGIVFGRKISFPDYQASLSACHNLALLKYGDAFSRVAKLLDLKKEAWQRLILLAEVKKEKIKVTDQEVIDLIAQMPLFHKGDAFDKNRYAALLNYSLHTSPREFEEQIRETIKIQKLMGKVIASLSLTDEEITAAYRAENEKARASYVLIEPAQVAEQIQPAYAELVQYYQNHQNELKKPEQVNIEYIALYFDKDAPTVDITEEEIQDYYQKNYPGKTPENSQALAELTEKLKKQIRETLRQEKTRSILGNRIWEICEQFGEENSSFEDVAGKNTLEIKETGFFGTQDTVPDIGLSYEFSNTAFSLTEGEISNVVTTPKGYFILKLKAKQAPHLPGLEEIKKEVEKKVIAEQSWQMAEKKGQELLDELNKLRAQNMTFAAAAEKLGLTVKESGEFTRASYISGIGQSNEFAQAAFELNPEEISKLIAVSNGFCILTLQGIIPVDEKQFIQEKEKFAQGLLERKKESTLNVWLLNLERNAKLVSNVDAETKE
ncbi:MAG: SurA N-terminal domain-containing protein [Candidatus Omnitrophota bacterium]